MKTRLCYSSHKYSNGINKIQTNGTQSHIFPALSDNNGGELYNEMKTFPHFKN